MSTSPPQHTPRRTLLPCLPQDAAAVVRHLPRTRIQREVPGSDADRHLDELVPKPWGVEFRIYDDALVDVWMLHLRPGTRTSMHSHPRKDTILLCVTGHGYVTDGAAADTPIAPGAIVQIAQGAAHRSTATTGMTLVEIETPRDKYDLVRLIDDAGRAGRGYERHRERHRVPIARVPDGPPLARLRPRCIRHRLAFALETGREARERAGGLAFAISLDALGVLRREIEVRRTGDLGAVAAKRQYLTIRSTDQKDAP